MTRIGLMTADLYNHIRHIRSYKTCFPYMSLCFLCGFICLFFYPCKSVASASSAFYIRIDFSFEFGFSVAQPCQGFATLAGF